MLPVSFGWTIVAGASRVSVTDFPEPWLNAGVVSWPWLFAVIEALAPTMFTGPATFSVTVAVDTWLTAGVVSWLWSFTVPITVAAAGLAAAAPWVPAGVVPWTGAMEAMKTSGLASPLFHDATLKTLEKPQTKMARPYRGSLEGGVLVIGALARDIS